MRTRSGLLTDSSTPHYARTTPPAVRTAKRSRYAGIYSGTGSKPVIADEPERPAFHTMKRAGAERHGRAGRETSERERASQTSYNNSLTSDFSSFNSASDESIFTRLKSFIGRSWTISHFPPRTRTGNDEINPFSTP